MERGNNKYQNSPGAVKNETLPMYENSPQQSSSKTSGIGGYNNPQYGVDVEDMDTIDLTSGKVHGKNDNSKDNNGDGDLLKKSTEGLDDVNADANEGWEMTYKLEDIPSWYDTLVLAFQVYLMMAGTTLSLPFIWSRAMCMQDNDASRAHLVSTFIFVSGIVTILQSSFGTRLPIVQGGSTAFMVPTLAILRSKLWECPGKEEIEAMSSSEKTELWQIRMREISGAIIVASLFQVFFGFFGVIGLILRYVTPMTIAPSITMIGLSLFEIAGRPSATHWPIALMTIAIIILFSQYLRKVKVPIPLVRSPKRAGWKRYKIFQNLPILFGMTVMWIFCAIVTYAGGFAKGSSARTDLNNEVIAQAPYFAVPYPFQWGLPTVSIGAVMGIFAGVVAGIIESIGDYYACARIIGSRAPPIHAVNRGIFVEGLGCIIAGIWGTGNGTTSYSENIGAIGVTQVGSRRVTQIGGLLMIFFSLFGKLNAIFVNIPEPVAGAFLVVVFSIVTAVGLSNLKGVDLNSSRNIFIIGFSIFFSMTVSQWMIANPNAIDVGNASVNQMLQTLLTAGMFLGGFFGFVLDNTIPGTRKERGLEEWEKMFAPPKTGNDLDVKVEDPYDLPFIMPLLQKSKLAEWIPISPTFAPEKYEALFRGLIFWRRPRHDM